MAWVLRAQPCALSLDGAFYIAQAAFFRQGTSFWALLLVILGFLAYRSGGGGLARVLSLAPLLAKPALRAWRRTYFFNRGLVNGLVLIHPLLVALAYGSVLAVYLGALRLGPERGGSGLRGLARLGCQSASAALLLGAWWAQQELN